MGTLKIYWGEVLKNSNFSFPEKNFIYKKYKIKKI